MPTSTLQERGRRRLHSGYGLDIMRQSHENDPGVIAKKQEDAQRRKQMRDQGGKYTDHNTPGDGTGFSYFAPHDYADVLTDVEMNTGQNEMPGKADGPMVQNPHPVKMPPGNRRI